MVIFLVFLGGGIGSVCRYLLGAAIQERSHSGFPYGTLAVNVLGCLAIGAIAKLFIHGQPQPLARTFLIVGFCGGFTTFSAFSYETVGLLQGGKWLMAGVYAGLSLVLCLLATGAAYALGPAR
jgi:fluoride exporter